MAELRVQYGKPDVRGASRARSGSGSGRRVRLLTHTLRRLWTARPGANAGQNERPPRARSTVAREFETIGHYARFAASQPDMPAYHRKCILDQIARCCEDAKTGFS